MSDLSWLKDLKTRKKPSIPFDFKSYMIENNISDVILAKRLGITTMGAYTMIKRGTIKPIHFENMENAEKYIIK